MRELAVYYCHACGYYGYYQLTANAVCPKCIIPMTLLEMRYQDFMDLGCEERDNLLSQQIVNSSSVVKRLSAPHKAANNRELIAQLTSRVDELEHENKKLHETINWMHQTIWDMVRKEKNNDNQDRQKENM